MSKEKITPYIIEDLNEIELLTNEFNKNIESLNGRIYNSSIEEKNRISKLILNKKINKPIDEIANYLFENLIQALHPDLKLEQIKKDQFYRTSKAMNKIPFRIKNFETNKLITIEWFTNIESKVMGESKNILQWFTRTIELKSSKENTITKITYYDIVKGGRTTEGYFDKRIKGVYIKKQVIAFEIQILNLKIALNMFEESKLAKINQKIAKLIDYSKNLY